MNLPTHVEHKLGMIVALGKVKVNVDFNIEFRRYEVLIGEDEQTFDTDEKFYEYVDKKLEALLNEHS